jgi:putative membrane protein
MWYGYANHMGWMWFWWIVGLGVLGAILWAMARSVGTSSSAPGEESPEAILKRRYARGEVDHDEYERRLSALRK